MTSSRKFVAGLAGMLLLAAVAGLIPGVAEPPAAASSPRAAVPEDRYAMAGGCYALRSHAVGGYVARSAEGFAATAGQASAEPFRFQATDLGSYLLFGSAADFFAASEGAVGEAANAATTSTPGGIAGGLSRGASDSAASATRGSAASTAAGRGAAIVAAAKPSDLADWVVEQAGANDFRLSLPSLGSTLVANASGALALVPTSDAGASAAFGLHLVDGCAAYPEIEIGIDGPVATGASPFAETRGYLDAHVHMMAFEFIGGRSRCGRPWHRYGVAYALVDCPDHEPNGRGAVLEMALTSSSIAQHATEGWPGFPYWPRYNSLTHEQLYYKWLERAWRGGLRLFVNLLVDNRQLCQIYPYNKNSCNEMDGVRLQAKRIRELERYIDAQSGGPGEGWFRIVTDPFEARAAVNAGKLAVVLGIEVSVPLDCGLVLDTPTCDSAQIDEQLDAVYDLGVRQMEAVNKFDNALSGVKGDAGTTGVVVNNGNAGETGRFWQMTTCDGDEHDHTQINVHDQSGAPDELTGRDGVFGAVLDQAGRSGAPVYPEGPHCNVRGLTPLGEHFVRGLMERGMIFDPDHMSAKARHQAMDIIESAGYSGVISSHSWSDQKIYERVLKANGVVTPYAGGSSSFVSAWRAQQAWRDPRFYYGIGFGSDVNGFGSQGAPRGASAANKVEYPFTGFGGATVHKQRSGTRVYDVNTDGVAHYGLYPDWIEDLRRQAGQQIVDDLSKGVEAYLQMWERASGIAPTACRPDVADLTDAQFERVSNGMSARGVVETLGQPASREASAMTFCASDGRTARVLFDGGTVSGVLVS